MKNRDKSRRLGFENLENRTLMAGNVLVSVENGVLTVTGDDAANTVYIRQIPPSGASSPWPGASYSIEGYRPLNGNPPTLVNGQQWVTVEGVKNGADIEMKGGNDILWINRPHTATSIASIPGASVDIDMGDGDDRPVLYIANHQQLNVSLGKGADFTYITGAVNELSVTGDPAWEQGDPPGGDYINLELTAAGPVSVDGKYGNNDIRLKLTTTTSRATVDINTTNGADKVDLSAATLSAVVRIHTGDGNDTVTFGTYGPVQSNANIFVNTSRGNDLVIFSDTSVDALFSVWLGEGDDWLTSAGTNDANSVIFRGSDGTDKLELRGTNTFDAEDISGFETIA
jgi:hypothetical protein